MPNALLSPLAAQSFGRLESAARRLEAATGLLRDFSGCTDSEVDCARWARQGECQNNPGFMLTGCRASCASCESEACHNKHDSCRAWAEQGECSANTDFMLQTCPFACGVCGVNYKKECRREASMSPAAVPGTVDSVFREALERYPQFRPRVLHTKPWVLLFENFLSPEEVDVLLEKGGHSFERSLAGDGVTPVRTSSTSWCNVRSCLSDPVVQAVRQRISNVTRVPWEYAEHLQLLKYEPGQFYREHHDQNSPRHSAWGPRLYTFFMYLSDVEEGGETRFTRLNISVAPRRGAAIFWPSVSSDDPMQTEDRTYHEACTVTKGVKYSANFWLHMYEFQQALARGCDNTNYYQNDMPLRRRQAEALEVRRPP